MNATDLIQLLREHPKACERLNTVLDEYEADDWEIHCNFPCDLNGSSSGDTVANFRRWLTGAAQEWCDEKDIAVFRNADGTAFWYVVSDDLNHPRSSNWRTRLEALLAAIEAHEP